MIIIINVIVSGFLSPFSFFQKNAELKDLFVRCERGDVEGVRKRMIDLDVRTVINAKDANDEGCLLKAVRNEHEGIIKLYHRTGADLNPKNNNHGTPLEWAIRGESRHSE